MVARDFFAVVTICLARAYFLFFIELASRQILQASVTQHPNGPWVTQQAWNLCWSLEATGVRPKLLLRDRDSKFSFGFDVVLANEGIATIRTPTAYPLSSATISSWHDRSSRGRSSTSSAYSPTT